MIASKIWIKGSGQPDTTIFPLSDDEGAREKRLREHFADFWAREKGTPRLVYDKFIAACPVADGVAFDLVEEPRVHGWWARPPHAAVGRAILFLHGGGYGLGSALAYRGFVSQIACRTGIAVLAIDYPLAPEAVLPAAPEAAISAWDYLVGAGFGRIAVAGDSAGGGLSLVTLTRLSKDGRGARAVAGAMFSPWTDLAFTGASMTDPAVVDPLIGHEYLRGCADRYRGTFDASDPLASPLNGNLAGLPPLLIQVGTDELLLDDSRRFAARAAEAGVPVQLELWEGMHHVFQLDVAHLESSRTALDRTAQFLRAVFGA
jgi:epsilon-lactone hydrolase